MIGIDGYNIKTTWTLEPVYEGLYNQLMKYPDLKERDTVDWTDRNGIQVLLSDARFRERELTLSFFCDTYAMYKAFIAYLKAHQNVILFDSHTDRTYTVEYMSCSSFQYCRNFNIFAIKVRECNPTVRMEFFLLTEAGLDLLTESGIGILIQ